MTPHDHDDDRETTASPQALIRDLRAQQGALPEPLRRQCLAAGTAMVPALIALLEAALAEDQAEPEGALFHAVDLLGALGDARAVPILLRCLAHDERRQSRAHVLPAPREPANSAGMPPAGVAAAGSIRNVIFRSNGPRESAWMASAPRLESIPPRRLRLRGIVVVGQPTAGAPGAEGVQST
jgi:hypothetical protein